MEFPNTYVFNCSAGGNCNTTSIFSKGKNQTHAYVVALQWLESKGIVIPEWFKNHNYQVIDISTVYGIYMITNISELSQYTQMPMKFTSNKFNDYFIVNKNNRNQLINVKASSLRGAYDSINTLFSNNGIKVPEWLTEGSPNVLCTEIPLETIQFISYINVS
jgi:hypothetical protein